MMLLVDNRSDYYRATVRLSGTETETKDAIIARAKVEVPTGYEWATIRRADDMSGDTVFEVTTITFWKD